MRHHLRVSITPMRLSHVRPVQNMSAPQSEVKRWNCGGAKVLRLEISTPSTWPRSPSGLEIEYSGRRYQRQSVVRQSSSKRGQQREQAEYASANERSEQRPAEDEARIGGNDANPRSPTHSVRVGTAAERQALPRGLITRRPVSAANQSRSIASPVGSSDPSGPASPRRTNTGYAFQG